MKSRYRCTVAQVMRWGPCMSRESVKLKFGKHRYLDFIRLCRSLDIHDEEVLWVLLRKEMLPSRVIKGLRQEVFAPCSLRYSYKEAIATSRAYNRGALVLGEKRITPLFTYLYWLPCLSATLILNYLKEKFKEKPW